jgi:hypothetical protein
VDYTSLPASAPTGVTIRRIYRTLDGNRRVAYLDVEQTGGSLTATTATGVKTDDELAVSRAYPLLDSLNRNATRNADPPPDHKPYPVWHLQRMYYLGAVEYTAGSIAVTNASATVTGVGTAWVSTFVGRALYVNGGDKRYEIFSVDSATQVTLTEPYTGTTALFASYAIHPQPAEENLVYYSEAGMPESVPAVNAFELPEDGDKVTGGMSMPSFFYVLKERHIYRFTVQSDPAKDGFLFPAADRGCVGQNCVAQVNDTAFLLDRRGAYAFSSAGPKPISDAVQDHFFPDSDRPINWRAAKAFHAVIDIRRDVVRFFVCLNGDAAPRDALAFNYRLGRWWTEEYPFAIHSSCSGRGPDGDERVFLGGPGGRVYSLGERASDVTPAVRTGVLSAGPATVAVVSTAFEDDLADFPVTVVAGKGKGQTRLVVAVVTAANVTTLTVNPPWSDAPDDTSTLLAGGVPYRMRTREFAFASGEANTDRSLALEFERRPGEVCDLKLRTDTDDGWRLSAATIPAAANGGVAEETDRAEKEIDLGTRPGVARVRFNGHRETYAPGEEAVQFEVSGASGDAPHAFTRVVVMGVK